LGSQFSHHNFQGDVPNRLPQGDIFPVTLPVTEAFQAVPAILLQLTNQKSALLSEMKHGGIRVQSSRLFYLPFEKRGMEYIQSELRISIQKNALFWGKGL
jgi:hypothetical protein